MATKAALFNDKDVFDQILRALRPDQVKSLGRRVRNFDEEVWQRHLEDIAFEVVLQKFRSRASLKDVLLKTGDAVLVEAAKDDRIWGVGIDKSDARIWNPEKWRGRNILGNALMKARQVLRTVLSDTSTQKHFTPQHFEKGSSSFSGYARKTKASEPEVEKSLPDSEPAPPDVAQLPTGDVAEKKIRSLKKKLRDIAKLKEKAAAGPIDPLQQQKTS